MELTNEQYLKAAKYLKEVEALREKYGVYEDYDIEPVVYYNRWEDYEEEFSEVEEVLMIGDTRILFIDLLDNEVFRTEYYKKDK